MINLVLNHKRFIVMMTFLGLLLLTALPSFAATFPFVSPANWSPDGSKVAIVIGNSVEVYDATTTQVLYILEGHIDSILMVAWSFDGSMIATPSLDQTIKLWNASDGKLLKTLSGQNDAITTVAWSPDGSRLVSSAADTYPSLALWDIQTGSLVSTHNGGTVYDAAFSPDGKKFSVSNSLSLSILDATTFQVLVTSPRVECCTNQMYSLKWSPDSSKLITGSINGLVTLWDANKVQILGQFQANPHYALDSREVDNLALSWVRAITFGMNGNTILAASGDGSVREWDTATGQLVSEAQITPFLTASWSPYGGQLAVWAPTANEITALSNEQDWDSSNLTGEFNIVVPLASTERLQAIATACNTPSIISESLISAQSIDLDMLVDQIKALPVGTIPTACVTDLIAVANSLQS